MIHWALVLALSVLAIPAALAKSPPPPLRLAIERDYPPFVFTDALGEPRGLSVDMLRAVADMAGLQFKPLPSEPLAALLVRVQRGEADVITSLRPTPERAAYLAFTQPYVEVPAVLVVRSDLPYAVASQGLAALGGQTVAVGAGYAVEGPMRKAHPSVVWSAVSDDTAALLGLARGEFAAAVLDAASAAWIIQQHRLHTLRSVGRVGFSYPLSFGVRRDRTDIVNALDRALLELPPAQRREIAHRWMGSLPLEAMAPPRHWPAWLGLATLALALLLVWGQRRGRRGR